MQMQLTAARYQIRPCRKIIALLLLTVSFSANAAESLRCGTNLVSAGATVVSLLEQCGKPAIGDANRTDFGDWTYNFGPDEFMMKVSIRDSEITSIERLGYGYLVDDAAVIDETRSQKD